MDEPAPDQPRGDKLDRALLLGERRNDLLTLREVERYGRENFVNPTMSPCTDCGPRTGTRSAYGSPGARPWSAPATGSLT
jgi:hypothetical protein